MSGSEIICGDCRVVLPDLPAGSAHCVVTSPPYWGLRDYGLEPSVWGGDSDCEHVWGEHEREHHPGQVEQTKWKKAEGAGKGGRAKSGQFCRLCGAWRGCYGLEPTIEMYVSHTVEIFREVRRVLRDDGTLWLNLGDSYASSPAGNFGSGTAPADGGAYRAPKPKMDYVGLKHKDLCGIPWRVALALQADGWYLRQDIIWAKPNPMPESVRDRCTKAHEYIFLLTKKPRYYYDAEAVREPMVEASHTRAKYGYAPSGREDDTIHVRHGKGYMRNNGEPVVLNPSGRNKRSVWTVSTAPFKAAHFATFPPELIRPCIRAGTSKKGCCPQCGAPWKRVVEKERKATRPGLASKVYLEPPVHPDSPVRQHHGSVCGNRDPGRHVTESHTIGWEPTCGCGGDPVPCVVMDPFAGSGTTGMVAVQEGQEYLLIERNPEYCEMARKQRLQAVETCMPIEEAKAGQMALFK